MSTLTLANRANLYDVQKLKAPDGGAVEVTNTLIERNDLINDLPALPSNGGLFHQGARTSNLPTATLTNIGGTWGSSKSERTPFVEALATVRSRFQSPGKYPIFPVKIKSISFSFRFMLMNSQKL